LRRQRKAAGETLALQAGREIIRPGLEAVAAASRCVLAAKLLGRDAGSEAREGKSSRDERDEAMAHRIDQPGSTAGMSRCEEDRALTAFANTPASARPSFLGS
jgi:hypothetical protein